MAPIPWHGMTRSELTKRLAKAHPELRQLDIERIVRTVFDALAEALCRGERVELRGFGAFSTRQYAPRVGRNPRTEEAVDVPAKRRPYFRAGKQLRERLNVT